MITYTLSLSLFAHSQVSSAIFHVLYGFYCYKFSNLRFNTTRGTKGNFGTMATMGIVSTSGTKG